MTSVTRRANLIFRIAFALFLLIISLVQPVSAGMNEAAMNLDASIHIPQRDIKIVLATGWQLGECITSSNFQECADVQVLPWEDWGNFENVWLNPDPDKTYYSQLKNLLSTGLSSDDFLYYSYSGNWENAASCENGQQASNGVCLNFRRPVYKRIDTDIGYIGESATETYSRRAGYMQKILDSFPNSEFLIIGHSLGGFTSAYWAGQASETALKRVNAVVTLDSPLQGKTGPCFELWGWNPTYSTPFLGNKDLQNIIRQAPNKVPLYTFRHFDDTFVPYEGATLDGAWTDTGISIEDNSKCSHRGVKDSNIVAGLISHLMISGAIGNPTTQKTVDAGDHSQPNPLLSRHVYVSKPTYFPGFMTPNIALETKINGIESHVTSAKFKPSVPAMTMQVKPPSQVADGCYDLQLTTSRAHIDSTDTVSQSVCYSGLSNTGTSDVALVIDRSCSMGCPGFDPNKIIQARKSAKLLVDLLEDGDRISVIPFNSNAIVAFALASLDTATRQQAKASIDGIVPDGGTSIGSGLQRALQQLAQGTNNRSRAIVLLSDGVERSSPLWNEVKDSVIASGIPIYVVGLGNQGNANDLNEQQLREIASVTGGQYFYSPDANDLRSIYDTIAGAVTNRQTIVQRGDFIAPGGSKTESVAIDSSISDVRFVLTWDTNQRNLAFSLQTPSGSVIDPNNAAALGVTVIQDEGYILYKISGPAPGTWTSIIRDLPLRSGERATNNENYNLGVSGQSTISLDLSVGDPLGLQTSRAYDPVPILVSIISAGDITAAAVQAEVRMPSGVAKRLVLFDNGGYGDGAANDNIYGATMDFASEPGSYSVVVFVEGETASGERFERIARQSIVLDSNPTPPADLVSMLVAKPGTPVNNPEFCLSYANRGPVAANNVALFAHHPSGDLADTTSSSNPGLLGYDLGWSLGTVPASASNTIRLQASNIVSNTSGRFPHSAIGSDVNLQTGRTTAPTTIDRNFGNNISIGGNELDVILAEGWSLVSLPRELTNPEISGVLCASQGTIEVILGFDHEGLTYDPSLPQFSTLKEFDSNKAYWFKASQPTILRITGDAVYEKMPLYLDRGWNLVPFIPGQAITVTEALKSIATDVELVLGFSSGAASYSSVVPPSLNTLTVLEPNQGYWIKMRRPGVLVYSIPSITARAMGSQNAYQSVAGIAATNEWINIYSTNSTYNGQPLTPGSVVTAIGEDGRLLGQVSVREEGWYGLLAVYGDDAYTAELDGARVGEQIRFLINGQPATITNGVVPMWTANGDLMQVDLAGSGPQLDRRLYLPNIGR